MTNNNKRGAAIEALRRAICIPNLEERVSATVDAIISIVDARIGYADASTRPSEPQPGEAAPASPDLGCITSPFVSRTCERGTRGCAVVHGGKASDGACRVKMDAARVGAKCARGTVGCVTHPGPDECGPSEDGEGPEVVRVEVGDNGRVGTCWGSDETPDGSSAEMGYRLVEYIPASRLQAAEASAEATRYAEAKAHDETLAKLADAEYRIAELRASRNVADFDRVQAQHCLERARIALEGVATLHGTAMTVDGRVEADERMRQVARTGLEESELPVAFPVNPIARIAELEADRGTLERQRDNANDYLTAAVKRAEEAEAQMRDATASIIGLDDVLAEQDDMLAEAWRWIECGRETVGKLGATLASMDRQHPNCALERGCYEEQLIETKRDLEQARAALKPFARHYEMMVARCREWTDDQPASSVACGLTMGHCHDAYDLLAALPPAAPDPDKDEAKCKRCGGTSRVQVPCPDDREGCLVAHFGPCPNCAAPAEAKPKRGPCAACVAYGHETACISCVMPVDDEAGKETT